jgi:hypothetical protein
LVDGPYAKPGFPTAMGANSYALLSQLRSSGTEQSREVVTHFEIITAVSARNGIVTKNWSETTELALSTLMRGIRRKPDHGLLRGSRLYSSSELCTIDSERRKHCCYQLCSRGFCRGFLPRDPRRGSQIKDFVASGSLRETRRLSETRETRAPLQSPHLDEAGRACGAGRASLLNFFPLVPPSGS